MNQKIVNIYLNMKIEGLFVFITQAGKINYFPWGVDAIVERDGKLTKVFVPWTSIEYIEEVI